MTSKDINLSLRCDWCGEMNKGVRMAKRPVCFCGANSHLDTNAKIYGGKEYGNGKIWLCDRWPECEGYVGTHPNTSPLGTIVDKETKKLRMAVHEKFDKQWKGGKHRTTGIRRGSAYKWLSGLMKMPRDKCHIANFTAEDCIEALEQMALHPYHDYIQAKRNKRKLIGKPS